MCISILVLTLDEELNLPECLRSVAWSDDVVVLDSYSSDGTERIARANGARFLQRRFDDWASHSNWALANIEFRHPWVFYIDADERMPADLRDELFLTMARPDLSRFGAFRLRYRNMFWGKWIRHATLYPTWITRLMDPTRVTYEQRLVNAHPIVDGDVGQLCTHFDHYSFNKGFEHWFAKHNGYSTLEAVEAAKSVRQGAACWTGLIHCDPTVRRRALKDLSCRLPARPLAKFAYMYLLRRGFLDGFPGLTYCVLQAVYEYMIELKIHEARRRDQGLAV